MTDGNPFEEEGVWLKAALHTHTARSDGELEPDAHVRHHEWKGFDVCAITDHWTLTKELSTEHCLVITGAELAADPGTGMNNDIEILAIGIDDIPEDPGGNREHWGPMDAYLYKTFPDLTAAAASITGQGGVAFIAHPYWSGMTLETVMEAEGVVGLEVWNASPAREDGRGDSSYVWDLALDRGKACGASRPTTATIRASTSATGGPWCARPSGRRRRCSRPCRRGHTYASNGPRTPRGRPRRRRPRGALQPGPLGDAESWREHGWAVRADHRDRQEETRILERDDHGLVVRARFTPPAGLPYRRLVIEDERGRRAWRTRCDATISPSRTSSPTPRPP